MAGRAAELAELTALLERAVAGHGGAALVTGESGLGKSRLLTEVAAGAAASGLVVLSGRAAPGNGAYRPLSEALLGHLRGTALPDVAELAPFRAALGRLIPGWSGEASLPDPQVDQVVLTGEALLRLFRLIGAERGCLLVLDELQWVDADTGATLEYLARVLRDSPVAMVLAARPPAPDRLDPLDPLGRIEALRLPLRRLDIEGIRQMTQDCLGGDDPPESVLRFLRERSDGVPLLVEELLAGLVESGSLRGSEHGWVASDEPGAPVPRTLAALVSARLSGLTPAHRRVVEAAAVLGSDVSWRILPAVTGLTEDDVLDGLGAAAEVQLLVTGGATPAEPGMGSSEWLHWRHVLTRDAVLDQINPALQATLARRGADCITGSPDRTADDDAIAAALYLRAGEPNKAAEVWREQAARAADLGALRTASALLDRAAEILPGAAGLAAQRVRVRAQLGHTSAAVDLGEAALRTTLAEEHADLCWQLARTCVADGRWESALEYLARAGRDEDARTLATAADAMFGAGDPDRASDLATRALAAAERDGLADQQCQALQVLGRCRQLNDPAAATAAFRQSANLARTHHLGPELIDALACMGTVELLTDEHPENLSRARTLAQESGMLVRVLSIDVLIADSVQVVDGPVAGAAVAGPAAQLAADIGLTALQAMLETFSGFGRVVAGEVSVGLAVLDRAAALPQAPVEARAMPMFGEALAALMANDLRTAADRLDAGVERLGDSRVVAPLTFWGLWALVLTVGGEPAAAAARDRLWRSPAVLRSVNRAAVLAADAVVAGRTGDAATAERLLEEANTLLAGMHWWRRLIRQITAGAQITDGWGDPVGVLRADLAVFESAAEPDKDAADGSDRLARTNRDLLRRAGVSVRRGRGSTAVPPDLRRVGVTSREMDVLYLVGQRMTNAEIAERLYLSERTVETHVSNLLAKTNGRNRADLLAALGLRPR